MTPEQIREGKEMSDLIERLQDLYLYMRDHYRQYPQASEEQQTVRVLKDAKRALEAKDAEIANLQAVVDYVQTIDHLQANEYLHELIAALNTGEQDK